MEEKLERTNKIVNYICFIGIGLMVIIMLLHQFAYVNEPNEQKKRIEEKNRVIKEYNADIIKYADKEIKGSEVKEMIDVIIMKNQSNVGDEAKFIGIKIKEGTKISSYKDQDNLKKACEKASVYSSKDGSTLANGDNDKKNVEDTVKQMNALKKAIKKQKLYKVETYNYQGIYTWIIISKQK